MSNKYLYRVIPLLTVVFLFATLVIPAFADSNPAFVVDISDAIKEVSYTDDEVYITYDVPLKPFSSIYGYEVGSDTLKHILDSTYIKFTHGKKHNITFFTSCFGYGSKNLSTSDGNRYYWRTTFSGMTPYTLDYLSSITTMFVNGVEYDVYSGSFGSTYRFANYSDVSHLPQKENEFMFMIDSWTSSSHQVYYFATTPGDYDISVGYYESKEVWASEYDSISGTIYPLGINANDFPNYKFIDVSDLRSGSSFDVTFDYRFSAEFKGAVSGGNLNFSAYFLDENLDLLNSVFLDQLDFTSTAISSSYSSTFTLPEGAAYFYIAVLLQDLNVSECKSYEFRMPSLQLTVPVSAVEYNSKQMDEINKKLDELKNQQQETNDKLDEIISGSPGANAGADNMQDVAGDYKDHVNDQLQDGQAQMDKLDQLPRPDVSGVVTLPEWATSDQFLGFNAVVATVWENETIYEIMVVASILMLASYILFGKKV